MVAATIHCIHYPEKLTGKVRVRKGFLGRLIPQVEYIVESFKHPSSCRGKATEWRDAEMIDILLLGDFERGSDSNYVASLKVDIFDNKDDK